MMRRTRLARLTAWWGLVTIFLIPLALRYITKEPAAISWLNVLSVVFIGLTTLSVLTGALTLTPLPKPFGWLLIVVCAALFYAGFFTEPLRNGIGLWTSRLLQPMLVGYGFYLLLAKGVITVTQLVQAFFWSLVPLLVLSGLQIAGYLPFEHTGRLTASYFYPNTFARYIEILLLITLPWILFTKSYKRLHLGIWILGAIMLLGTKSYNGVASLFLALFFLFAILPQPFRQLKRGVLAGMAVLFLIVAVNAPKLPKWHISINDSRVTRLEFWDVALGAIGDNFWTGIGIKTWEKTYDAVLLKQYGPANPLTEGSVQPHNVYLDSFIKAGLPGFFAIMALLLWPVTEGLRFAQSYWDKQREWWFGVSVASYGVAMLLFGLIDDPLWSDDTMPVLFILLFALTYLQYHSGAKRKRA